MYLSSNRYFDVLRITIRLWGQIKVVYIFYCCKDETERNIAGFNGMM